MFTTTVRIPFGYLAGIAIYIFVSFLPSFAGMKVMATTLPVYIFAKNVTGDRADVALLIPQGTDVHEFTMRPLDMKRLSEADAVVLSGAGLDDHIRKRLLRAKTIDASKGIDLIRDNNYFDPHIWLDPQKAVIQVRNIKDGLSRLDPMNAQYFEKNAGSYIKMLEALDKEMEDRLMGLRGSYLITYHEAFNYFAKRYGLIPYSLTGLSAESPLPGRIKEIYDIVKAHGIKAIFVEKQFPNLRMEGLKKELGVRVCTLDTIETGKLTAGYYEDAMRQNMTTVLRCLQ